MKDRFTPLATICYLAALLIVPDSLRAACGGQLAATITNLPEIDLSGFQVSALNDAGQLTGFFFVVGDHGPHAFLYGQGALTDLGTLGGDTGQGNVLNAAGQIAGASQLADLSTHPFFYEGVNLADLGTLGGSYATAQALNGAGQIAGLSYTTNDEAIHGFLYSDHTMIDLQTLGGLYSSAVAINKAGTIAGQSTLASGDEHGFLYTAGTMLDLGTLGGSYSATMSLNDLGTVVGESSLASGDVHAFAFSNGQITDLGTFGGTYSSAYAVNASDQIMGVSSLAGDVIYHGFFDDHAVIVDLGTLGGDNTFPYAMNDAGEIVGQSDTENDGPHAFFWRKGALIDLNALLPTNSGWQLQTATLINNTGRIVGVGTHNDMSEWFILDLSSANNPPVAVAGADQVVDCQAAVTLDGSQSHDPDGDVLSFEWTSGGFLLATNVTFIGAFALGTNVVTLKVTDPCGASSQSDVTVVVLDNKPPVLVSPGPMIISAGANCQAVLPNLLSRVTVSDNCSSAESITLNQAPVAGTVLDLGPHTVVVTATDLSGNRSSNNILVTVTDTTPPTILSGPVLGTIPADQNCQGRTPAVISDIRAIDNCTATALLVISQDPAAGALVGLGSHRVLVTVKDAAGNQTQGTLDFVVADQTAPIITSFPSSVTVSVGSNGRASVPNVLPDVVAIDGCTAANQLVKNQSLAPGTSVGKGTYSITINVADAAGNSSACQVSLVVVDTTAPVIASLKASPNILAPPNHAMIPITVSVTASDNCDAPASKIICITCNEVLSPGEVVITGDLSASLAASRDGNGYGRVYTIIVQSSDLSGNTSTSTVTVTVPQGNR